MGQSNNNERLYIVIRNVYDTYGSIAKRRDDGSYQIIASSLSLEDATALTYSANAQLSE